MVSSGQDETPEDSHSDDGEYVYENRGGDSADDSISVTQEPLINIDNEELGRIIDDNSKEDDYPSDYEDADEELGESLMTTQKKTTILPITKTRMKNWGESLMTTQKKTTILPIKKTRIRLFLSNKLLMKECT